MFEELCKSAYFQQKSEQLEKRLDEIEGHNPDFQDLCVVGVRIDDRKKLSVSTETVQLKHSTRDQIDQGSKSTVSLVLNGFEFNPESSICSTHKIYVRFQLSDITESKVSTEYIRVENNGTSTIRFHFKRLERPSLLGDIVLDNDIKTFYFTQNEELVVPGEKFDLPVHFKSSKAGTFTESWELVTSPKLVPNGTKLVVIMQAHVSIENMKAKCNGIRREIGARVRSSIGKKCLLASFDKIEYIPATPTVYRYDSKKVFQAINTPFNLSGRSKYGYNQEVVGKLQELYKCVRRTSDPPDWNYNITDLQILTKTKQLESEGAELEQILDRLEEGECEDDLHGYMDAYLILSTCFDKIGEAVEELKDAFGITFSANYPQFKSDYETAPPQLMSPVFCNEMITPSIKERFGKPSDRQPPEAFNEIEKGDVKKRWRTYFNVTESPPVTKMGKGKKGKKAPRKESPKKQTTKKDVPKRKSTLDSEICPEFNPYADFKPSLIKEEISKHELFFETNLNEVPPSYLYQYQLNMYIIFYSNLSAAISNITDMIESNSIYKPTPLSHVKENETCKYIKQPLNLVLSGEEKKGKFVLNRLKTLSKKDDSLEELRRHQTRAPSTSSSLWSILQPHKTSSSKIIPHWRPISYPMEHYDTSTSQDRSQVEMSTSMSDCKIDPNRQDFKDASTQPDYQNDEDDIEVLVERMVREINAESSTTEEIDEDFDRERFYGSDSEECNCDN